VGLTAGAASFALCAKGAGFDPSDMTETSTHVFKRDVRKCLSLRHCGEGLQLLFLARPTEASKPESGKRDTTAL
jgi:hypothetical protein